MRTERSLGRRCAIVIALMLVASLAVAVATQALADESRSARIGTDSRASAPDEEFRSQMAPTRPADPIEPHPWGGYVPPAVDLAGYEPGADSLSPAAELPRFDWREQGIVTRVQNQNPCGACYAFACLAAFESRILVDGGGSWDLSENHAKECGYDARSCAGGDFYEMANLFSQTGTVLESCDPFVPADVPCTIGCPYQQTLLDWGVISGASIPSPAALKSYITDHGPIMTSLYVGSLFSSWQKEFSAYDGSYALYYSGAGTPNHAVLIVGWDDSLAHAGGSGAWIVKNSWGTDWGGTCGYGTERGYFAIAYGSAKIGYDSAYVGAWQEYDADGDVLFYDEAGWTGSSRGYGNVVAWGLARYYMPEDTAITRVEFWTTDVTTDVDVYLYGDFDGSTLSNLLAQKLDCSFGELGYHSVALDVPVPVAGGDDVIAVVRFSNQSYKYPLAVDTAGAHLAGRSYISGSGASWTDIGTAYSQDIGIRVRTSSRSDATPMPTATSSLTPTVTRTRTPSRTPSATRTATRTLTPTRTTTPTRTRTTTPTPTWTPTTTPSMTASQTPRPTNTPGPPPTWVPGAQPRLWMPAVPREHSIPATHTVTPTSSRTRTPTATTTPTGTHTPAPTETPTSTPGVYYVGDTLAYIDNIDYLRVIGEIENGTDDTLRFVRVTVDLLDAQGALLGSDYTYTRLKNLSPHSRTCFHVMIAEHEGATQYQLRAPSYWTDGTPPPQLVVVSQTGTYDSRYGWYGVEGEIRNDEASAVKYVRPVVSLYDGVGRVVGCESAFVDGSHLQAGQIGAFKVMSSGRDYEDVTSYRVQVDGEKQP